MALSTRFKIRRVKTTISSQVIKMGKIASMEYFRVPPRWLFVKITDDTGNVGWGEATLEGHTQAVEGCLDAWFERYTGFEADDIEHIWQMSWRTTFYRGGPVFMSALAGIDIALWDLKGACPEFAQIYRCMPRYSFNYSTEVGGSNLSTPWRQSPG